MHNPTPTRLLLSGLALFASACALEPASSSDEALVYRFVPRNPGEEVSHPCTRTLETTYNLPDYGPTTARISFPTLALRSGCSNTPVGGETVLLLPGNGFEPADYSHLTDRLAENGFLVVAVDGPEATPSQNCGSVAETCAPDRAERAVRYLEHWVLINGLAGSFDTSELAIVGHSRGGEGALFAAQEVHDSAVLADTTVRAVIALAPTDTWVPTVNAAETRSVLVVHGTRDEDVGLAAPYPLYERIGTEYGSETPDEVSTLDRVERSFMTVERANHRQFTNDCGVLACQGGTSGLMDCAVQQSVARGLVLAWLRLQMRGETIYRGFFDGTYEQPLRRPLGSAAPEARMYAMYDEGRPLGARVEDNLEDGEVPTSTRGGTVIVSGINASVVDSSNASSTFPHDAPGRHFLALSDIGDPLDTIEWQAPRRLFGPAPRPWTAFTTFSLRAARVFSLAGDFEGEEPVITARLRMSDGSLGGTLVELPPLPPPAVWPAVQEAGCGFASEKRLSYFRSLRVPLDAFEPVDWTRVRSIVLSFDDPDLADETVYIDSVRLSGATEWLVLSPSVVGG